MHVYASNYFIFISAITTPLKLLSVKGIYLFLLLYKKDT